MRHGMTSTCAVQIRRAAAVESPMWGPVSRWPRAPIQYYPRRGFRETHRATDAGYQRVYFSRCLDPQQT